jgi:hypothetical protein
MACQIIIEDAKVVDASLTSIEISGTAQDCDRVIVGLSCIEVGAPFIEVEVPVQGGQWTALFPDGAAAGCSCKDATAIAVFAVARCPADPNCIVTPHPFKKEVTCPAVCPIVILTEPELAPTAICNADGTVTVTLKANVSNNTGTDAIVHIECGNGAALGITQVNLIPQGTGDTIEQVCVYTTPVTPQPFVVVDLPAGCPHTPIDVDHQICCPDPANVQVTVGDCVNGKRQVTFHFGGTFSGTIQYGDGVSEGFLSAQGLIHGYSVPPSSYTALLEIAFCNDIPIQIDGLEPCARIGACCLPDGSCEVIEESECLQRSGVFQGEGVACEDVTCPPTGACCLPDGSCAQHTQADCEALSGQYLGDGTTCATDNQIGACCLPDDSCVDLTHCECLSRGGTFLGVGTSCAADNQVGACCLPDDSCEELARCACLRRGGTFRGVGVSCDEVECISDGGSCFDSLGAFLCCLLQGLLLILILAFIGQVVAAFCFFPPNTTLILTAAATLGAILLLLLLLRLCSWSFCRALRALIWTFEWTAIACLVAFFFCMNAVLLIVAFGFGALAGLLFLIRPSCGWPKLLRLP